MLPCLDNFKFALHKLFLHVRLASSLFVPPSFLHFRIEFNFLYFLSFSRLQYLNLADNNISSVPHLKLLGQKSDLDLNSNGHKSSVKNTGLIAKDRLQVLGPITNVDEVLESELADVNSKIDTLKDILYNINNEEVDAVNNSIERESVSRAHGHLKGKLHFLSL